MKFRNKMKFRNMIILRNQQDNIHVIFKSPKLSVWQLSQQLPTVWHDVCFCDRKNIRNVKTQ